MRSIMRYIPLQILLLLTLLFSCKPEEERKVIQPNELREVGKLELVEYRSEEIFVISSDQKSLESIRSLEEAADYLSSLFEIGDRIGIYSFDFYTIAYINLYDLQDSDLQYDQENKSIQLTLPPIEVEPIGRGGTLKLLHERVNGNKKSITSEERQNMQRQAVVLAKQNIRPGTPKYQELVTKAQSKAQAYFTSILRARGYEEIEIRFTQSYEKAN